MIDLALLVLRRHELADVEPRTTKVVRLVGRVRLGRHQRLAGVVGEPTLRMARWKSN